MKVIIAGSRNVPPRISYPLIVRAVAEFEQRHGGITEVVSGAEPTGVDRQGETWAEGLMVPVTRFPFMEGKGRAGGPIRNSQMAAYADGLILVCHMDAQGEPATPGSLDMLKKARAQARKRAFPIVSLTLSPEVQP